MQVTAIVPLKALRHAKQRLAGAVHAADRVALMAAMASHVVRACRQADGVGRVLVVAGDADAERVGRRAGADDVLRPAVPGLRAALEAADRAVPPTGATLVVVADLPLATAADIDAVCAAATSAPCVVLVATRDGGTGALLRRPGRVIPTAFGPSSAAAHAALAVRAGVPAVRLDLPGLALDLDTPAQLGAIDWPDRREPTTLPPEQARHRPRDGGSRRQHLGPQE